MQIFKIFDNGGKTIDRYTILTEAWHFGKSCNAFGCSNDPIHPQGVGYWTDVYEGAKLGKEITFEELPEAVKNYLYNYESKSL